MRRALEGMPKTVSEGFDGVVRLRTVSMNAERAAQRILRACIRGEAEVVLSLAAKFAVKFNALFPGITADMMAART